jgi:hypothetical protein
MDSRPPFFDWLHLAAASAACNCERVCTSQHDADHPTNPTTRPDEPGSSATPRQVRRVRLIPCTPALHAVGE